MGTNILTDEQYKMLSKKLINTLEKHYKIIPLNTLKNSHFVLKKPIYITIEKEDDIVATVKINDAVKKILTD